MGPNEKKLREAIVTANFNPAVDRSLQWAYGGLDLKFVGTGLRDTAPKLGEYGITGETAEAANAAFLRLADEMDKHWKEMEKASKALSEAADAFWDAEQVARDLPLSAAVADPGAFQYDPNSSKDLETQKLDHGKDASAYSQDVAAREKAFGDALTHVDTVYLQSSKTLAEVHGMEPPAEPGSTPGGGGPGGGGGYPPIGPGGGLPPTGDPDFDPLPPPKNWPPPPPPPPPPPAAAASAASASATAAAAAAAAARAGRRPRSRRSDPRTRTSRSPGRRSGDPPAPTPSPGAPLPGGADAGWLDPDTAPSTPARCSVAAWWVASVAPAWPVRSREPPASAAPARSGRSRSAPRRGPGRRARWAAAPPARRVRVRAAPPPVAVRPVAAAPRAPLPAGPGAAKGAAGSRAGGRGAAGAGGKKNKDDKSKQQDRLDSIAETSEWIDDEGAAPGVID